MAFTQSTVVVTSKQKQEPVVNVHTTTTTTTTHAPAPTITLSNPRESSRSTRPLTRPAVRAIPTTRPMVRSAPPTTYQKPQATSYSVPSQPVIPQQQQQQQATTGTGTMKKRSRKEMERALRAGQLNVVQDEDAVFLEAGSGELMTHERALAARAAATSTSSFGGCAKVQMYDPKAGSAVTSGVSQTHKQKHQINQLLANAATLEAHRSQSSTVVVKGSASRINAKKKYGW
eukprot:scaffold42797_cov52-Attheya_sp.AAC.2